MTNAWQNVQGNYPPADSFVRDNAFQVLTKDIRQIDTDLWQWKEYHMPIDVYEAIVAGIENGANLPSENQNGLFDFASLIDENSEAIMELADIIAEMEG